ncbi:unnamed protein product [Allacma fusca]|uniref:Uncharacterized protein n=1 Tax=Allacma fusca TaxID=39272 RepID=A0A8J2KJ92_9HEXA|nr:unnamed protein product [Allacma fusca]
MATPSFENTREEGWDNAGFVGNEPNGNSEPVVMKRDSSQGLPLQFQIFRRQNSLEANNNNTSSVTTSEEEENTSGEFPSFRSQDSAKTLITSTDNNVHEEVSNDLSSLESQRSTGTYEVLLDAVVVDAKNQKSVYVQNNRSNPGTKRKICQFWTRRNSHENSHLNNGLPSHDNSSFIDKIWTGLKNYGFFIIGLAVLVFVIFAILPKDMKSQVFGPRKTTTDILVTHPPTNAISNLSKEELVHRHSMTIDSPLSLPYELPPVTLELHLAPRRKFKWSNWNVSNLEAVESLVLEGPLDEEDIRFLILSMPNLNSVSILLDKGMCSIVDSVEDEKLNEHINIQSLTVSGMETCHNLFAFVARTFHFSKLESITLEDVPVMFENMGFIHELLKTHRETLRRLFLNNVVVCHHCFLFDKVFLRWVDEARFKFLRPETLPAKKSLENFNLGTPRIAHFESNIRCSDDERKTYLSNWVNITAHFKDKICSD